MVPTYFTIIEADAWVKWNDEQQARALAAFRADAKPATDPQDDVILWWPQ